MVLVIRGGVIMTPPWNQPEWSYRGMWGVKLGVLGYAQFIWTISSWLTCVFHVYSRGFKLRISIIVTFDWIVTQRWVRCQSGGSWGWQTQLDHSQVCSTCIHVYAREIHVLHTCEWSSCVCHPQEPPLWPLTHLWVTIQSKVTIREILSLKPLEYTWDTHFSQLKIV